MTKIDVPNIRDFEWQQAVLGIETEPPSSPSRGDRYIVGLNATGDWETQDNNIAYYDTEWLFDSPSVAWFTYVIDEGFFYRFVDNEWERFTSSPIPETAEIDHTDSPFDSTEFDIIIADSSEGEVEITLPEVTPLLGTENQRTKIIIKNDWSDKIVRVKPSGTDKINGMNEYPMWGSQLTMRFEPNILGWGV